MKIQLTQTTFTRSNERKSWQEKINSTEKREISLNEYGLLTNDEQTALNWEVKYGGTTYIDTRYEAKKRLYWYLWRKKRIQSIRKL